MGEFPKALSTRDSLKKSTRASRLSSHRRKTHTAVRARERGRCAVCKWNAGSDMHHVFRRGRDENSRKEQLSSVLYICRLCHGKIHEGKIQLPELEEILLECIIGTRFTWEPPL